MESQEISILPLNRMSISRVTWEFLPTRDGWHNLFGGFGSDWAVGKKRALSWKQEKIVHTAELIPCRVWFFCPNRYLSWEVFVTTAFHYINKAMLASSPIQMIYIFKVSHHIVHWIWTCYWNPNSLFKELSLEDYFECVSEFFAVDYFPVSTLMDFPAKIVFSRESHLAQWLKPWVWNQENCWMTVGKYLISVLEALIPNLFPGYINWSFFFFFQGIIVLLDSTVMQIVDNNRTHFVNNAA